jgi:LmbE family N-acetylglucosaminyl deacetylase
VDAYDRAVPGRPQLVVSPHFDDAALSVAHLLQRARAGATVVTVCGGVPPIALGVKEWDRRAGFTSGWEAANARALEDQRSCAVTGARPHLLGNYDSPYGGEVDAATLVEEVGRLQVLRDGAVLWMPAGIINHDHEDVRNALLPLARSLPRERVRVYADLPYAGPPGKGELPGEVGLALPGLVMHEEPLEGEAFARKIEAVKCHGSQLELLREEEDWRDLLEPNGPLALERFWSR